MNLDWCDHAHPWLERRSTLRALGLRRLRCRLSGTTLGCFVARSRASLGRRVRNAGFCCSAACADCRKVITESAVEDMFASSEIGLEANRDPTVR